jgi:hypothetical protein
MHPWLHAANASVMRALAEAESEKRLYSMESGIQRIYLKLSGSVSGYEDSISFTHIQ